MRFRLLAHYLDTLKHKRTYHPLPSMVLDKDCVDDHDVAERCNGNGNETVPGGEHLKDEDVDRARDWEANHVPGRLKKQSVRGVDGSPKVTQGLNFVTQLQSLALPAYKIKAVEKSCLFTNKYQSLKKFWVIFWVKTHFWPKKHFSAERKNGRFSVIPAGTRSIVIVGSKKCLDDLESIQTIQKVSG